MLEELGIQVPEEAVKALGQAMEGDSHSRIWIEGYPYYALLTAVGAPEWDEETWQVTGFSDQVFWFDWEAFDLEGTYRDILAGIDAMYGESCVVTDIRVDASEVDWEKGSGRSTEHPRNAPWPCTMTGSIRYSWNTSTAA